MSVIRRAIATAVTTPPLLSAFRPFMSGCATVFMLHRFADPEADIAGDSPALLRRALEFLSSQGFDFVTIDEVACRLAERPDQLTRAIAFTVDDGYAEFERVAAPIFLEFGCPVTVYLPTGFIDRTCWMWWDRIGSAFARTDRQSVRLDGVNAGRPLTWSSQSGAEDAAKLATDALKSMPDIDCDMFAAHVEDSLGVDRPGTFPARYEPLSWDSIRSLSRKGISFGAHTVSHPILSRLGDQAAFQEISQSWTRLREELPAYSSVFCYPVGRPQDVLGRDRAIVREVGFSAGLSTVPEHVTPGSPDPFFLPRFSFPDLPTDLKQIVGGVERAKARLRARLSTRTAVV